MSGSTKRRPRSDKRARIVDAAIEVFAAKGFHSARISDIARLAGVADGTIYLYFRNKEDLLLSIFEEKMELLIVELRGALDGVTDPVERLKVCARQHFIQLEKYPALAQVLQVELRQSHKFLREYRPEKLWEYLAIFEDIIRDGQTRGSFRSTIDPFLAQWAFFGALDELSIQWVLSKRKRFTLQQAADQILDVFLCGMAIPRRIE
ncbi:MAG: TetR/AcrR family fatty acid metabolism transcriptional regulator [Myxococcota bacterium]|jgi:TetR/AcrR family fatty acid metabolism transcriptional regulator